MPTGPDLPSAAMLMRIAADHGLDLTVADADSYRSSGKVTSSSSSSSPNSTTGSGSHGRHRFRGRAGPLELVQAQARDHPAQKGSRFAHRVSVDVEPAQEGILDYVLRVRDRAQHPIGNADKTRAQWIVDGGGVLARCGCHQAAFFSSAGWTARKPILIRFQALTSPISSVSFTCSSSVKCRRSTS